MKFSKQRNYALILLFTASIVFADILQEDLAILNVTLDTYRELLKTQEPEHPLPEWQFTLSSLRETLKIEVDNKGLEEPEDYQPALIPLDELLNAVEQWAIQAKEVQKDSSQWLAIENKQRSATPPENFYDIFEDTFIPFAQKITVPVDAEIALWGDTHGSASSLVRTLRYLFNKNYLDDNFKITKDNFFMVFLGDFVDRGMYCTEVLYVLLRLSIANPDNVILVRGNHEDRYMNNRYGFKDELFTRYGDQMSNDAYLGITGIFKMLAPALFIVVESGDNTHAVYCSHGAFELGYDARKFLDAGPKVRFERIYNFDRHNALTNLHFSEEETKENLADILVDFSELKKVEPKSDGSFSSDQYLELGFAWYDFLAHDKDFNDNLIDDPLTWVGFDPNRGMMYGKDITKAYLRYNSTQKTRLKAIFRAHQHNSTMNPELWDSKGFFPLWNTTVFTLLSAPQAFLGFHYDSCVIAHTAAAFEDWKFTHVWQDLKGAGGFVRDEISIN